MAPEISVIVTTYNDAQYLSSCINSIECQVQKPKEVIIVDDGSEDDIAHDFVNENKFSFPIFFYKKKNGGASDARNYGLSKAKSEFVAFLDVDDCWLKDNLSHKFSALKRETESYFGVYAGFISTCKKRNKSTFMKVDGKLNADLIGKINGFPGGAPLYLFRKAALDNIGGFDVNLKQNEDFDLILRLIKAGYSAAGDNTITYVRNMRQGSLTRNKMHVRKYVNVCNFLDKAESNNYLSANEIMSRRSLNALSCWKSLFLSFQKFRFQKELLDIVFDNVNYRKKRYILLRAYSFLLARLL